MFAVDSAQLLREARRRAGLTQQQVADRADVSQSLIARIEAGRVSPSFDRLLSLVRTCDLDIRVVALDEDAWSMVEQGARLSPDERLDRAVAAVQLQREAQLSVEDTDG